jgi:hypothetical protein
VEKSLIKLPATSITDIFANYQRNVRKRKPPPAEIPTGGGIRSCDHVVMQADSGYTENTPARHNCGARKNCINVSAEAKTN